MSFILLFLWASNGQGLHKIFKDYTHKQGIFGPSGSGKSQILYVNINALYLFPPIM
jgi:hypothetical protein